MVIYKYYILRAHLIEILGCWNATARVFKRSMEKQSIFFVSVIDSHNDNLTENNSWPFVQKFKMTEHNELIRLQPVFYST